MLRYERRLCIITFFQLKTKNTFTKVYNVYNVSVNKNWQAYFDNETFIRLQCISLFFLRVISYIVNNLHNLHINTK